MYIGGRMRRNTNDKESREFWEHVDQRAANVEKWPAWKRGEREISEEKTLSQPKSQVCPARERRV